MMPNQIENGDFEGTWHHPGGVPELQIPDGWLWHNHAWPDANPHDSSEGARFIRPEVNVKLRSQLPEHERDLFILDGGQCLKISLGSGAWWGGMTQTVQFDRTGAFDLVLNVYGDLVKGYANGNKIWADDPAGRDGMLRIRIGEHWLGWQSIAPGQYSGYVWDFEARAGALEITVEVMCPFPLANAGIFADAWLIRDHVPDDQYQFDSVIHLIPQDATLEERRQVEALAFPDKQTVTFSADEAGANSPAKSRRRVDVWNAARWGGKHDLMDYWIQRHSPPPDEVNWREFVGSGNGGGWDRFLLWQRDPRWRNYGYGAPGCDLTVGEAGCYLTCLAMAQRIKGIRVGATPVTVNRGLGPSGYAAPNEPCRPWWTAIEDQLHLKVRAGTEEQAHAHLRDGGVAMAEVLPHSLEHFVLVVESTPSASEYYLALDPLRNEVINLKAVYDGVESWRILTPVEPDTEPQYPPVEKLLCIHMQDPVPYWLEWVQKVKPEGHKLVHTNIEAAADVADVSPETLVWFRHWHNNQQEFYDDPDVGGAVDRWLNRFWHPDDPMPGGPGSNVRAVCGLNEEIGTGLPEKTAKVVRFEAALAYEVQRRSGGLVVPVLLNPGVGNPDLDEHHLLLPAVQAAIDTGGFIGHHSYWGVDRGESHLMRDWEWHAGRCFEHWDPFFRSQDLYPRYLLTEVGAVWDDAGSLRAHNGWRSPECYGGNWDRYLSDLMTFRARVTAWNIQHGNRCLAASIFTSGGGGKWDSFEIKEPELRSLEAALAN